MTPPRVLVIDDEAPSRDLMRHVLESQHCEVDEASNGRDALDQVRSRPPDLIICDALMPGMDGYAVVEELKSRAETRLIPVIMATALQDLPDRLKAVELGVDDFLVKPVNIVELITRARALISLKRFTDQLEQAATVLQAIAVMVEKRDGYTGEHCTRVGETSARLGAALGLDAETCEVIRLGGILHDVGKLGTADAILRKADRLSPGELSEMKRHATEGAALCAPMHTLTRVVPIIRSHHERLDGSGYPEGLRGNSIPVEVRIVAVCDIYDALASKRPYKDPFPRDRCLSILREEAVRGWWDRDVVEEFARLARMTP